MAVKRYISKTGVKYSFLVEVNGKVKSISFKGNEKDCIVINPATQKAVEESKFFVNGLIGVAQGTTAGGFDEEIDGLAGVDSTEAKLEVKRANSKTNSEQGGVSALDTVHDVREDITDYTSAREVLLNEPYNLTPQAVSKNPESILKKASELGVSFPNLPSI